MTNWACLPDDTHILKDLLVRSTWAIHLNFLSLSSPSVTESKSPSRGWWGPSGRHLALGPSPWSWPLTAPGKASEIWKSHTGTGQRGSLVQRLNSLASRARLLGSNPRPLGTFYLTCGAHLCLSYLICNMEIIRISTSWVAVRVRDWWCMKYPGQCSAESKTRGVSHSWCWPCSPRVRMVRVKLKSLARGGKILSNQR